MVLVEDRRRIARRGGIAAVLLALLAGCTGADFVLPPVSDTEVSQASLTVSSAPADLPKYRRSDDDYWRMLQRVAARLTASAPALCQHAKVENCTIGIKYSPEDTVNAYADGENSVTVHRGLLELLQTEDEVAAVVGHEFGHHLGEHLEERRNNAIIGAVVGGLLAAGGAIAGGADPNDAGMPEAVGTWAGIGAAIGALSYSKSEEREADLLSAYLLARANYDLRKAGRTFWVLAQQDKNKVKSSMLDTHPAGPERIVAWDKAIVEVEKSPNKLPTWKP